ncbi:Uncharacterized Fe-S center protein [Archaeoglobus sulfaticallidus PM70-1]|uniref:Uncharacterized Fe-S center protein n=1 Tax=Archaeoglobus sulfaticallidus PM70-1 TaxID=387631 RepID=N0BDG6_9EURY|nr:DUF362 domain-containing protein [Archaeoglobus sulfaticallidus]AGK61033.1 Uncharacterized Fe-S center protein [Archaeoglobus sulfaticallidus PM70-1]
MSDVFFADSRAMVTDPSKWFQPSLSLVSKLKRLIDESKILDFIDKGDIVAVKTHFGDRGTTKTLRSVYIRTIVKEIKKRGGKPFVTETTGLGLTRLRSSAIGRIEIAEENGYTSQTLLAPIIIADGVMGFDFVKVNINGRHLKDVFVAKAFESVDKVVCATHFKLHMMAGMGGSIKNVGVGCVAKPSKYDLHCPNPPYINENCTECGDCVEICPAGAIKNFRIDHSICLKCTGCSEVCKYDAVTIEPWLGGREIGERIVECAKGVYEVVGEENFAFFNFMIDVTPHCDCHPYSDNNIIPDVGIFVSRDIVSVDAVCLETLQKLEASRDALTGDKKLWDWTSPQSQLDYAEEIGLGERKYELFRVGD